MTEYEPLYSILSGSEDYVRLKDSLASSEGPVSVFGLGESERTHISCALHASLGGTMLYIAPSAQSAVRCYEAISVYHPSALYFPAREVPLNAHTYVQSQDLTARRMKVIAKLVSGEPCIIVAPIDALMQRMVMPEVITEFCCSVRIGMTIAPASLLKRFIDAGYERVEVCEGRGQVCLRGGCIDIFPITAMNPVRIEFFDDDVDTMREFDPVSQRSIENISSVAVPPATEIPLTREMRQRGISALRSKPKYELEVETLRSGGTPNNALSLVSLFCREEISLIDYLPKDAVIIMEEPSRVEESAKFTYSRFMDELSDVLRSGEGHEMQAGLIHTTSSTFARLDTPRTAMLFALTRSYPLIRPKATVKIESRQIPK